ncbi:MAG: hypothetical protein KAS23_15805, partial [Anaerohalosphaera sp.]|nr:hypothetical protein [Anaerohalosphaera sp.]
MHTHTPKPRLLGQLAARIAGKDPKLLAISLSRLIEDKRLREKMGQAGYQKSRKEFDENKVCKTVLDTYDELL